MNVVWITLHRGTWILGTWLPACYSLPPEREVEICVAVVDDSDVAQWMLSESVVARFDLSRLAKSASDPIYDGAPKPA